MTRRLSVEQDHSRGSGYVIYADAVTLADLHFAIGHARDNVADPTIAAALSEACSLFDQAWNEMDAEIIRRAAKDSYSDPDE